MKKAFSLAEVLTTLTVIGIIAVVTIPILGNNTGSQVNEKQKKVFEQKLNDGLHRMQIKGELAKDYESTQDFIKTMEKYFSFSRVCESGNLTGCFAKRVKSGPKSVIFETKDISKSSDLEMNFGTDTDVMGLIFNDGTRALFAYDTSCVVADTWSQTANVSLCLAMYYDLNGAMGPDIVGDDIVKLNIGYGNIKIDNIRSTFAFSVDQCQDAKADGAPIQICCLSNDYWSYAAYTCHKEGKRLPTTNELKAIATQLYGSPIKLSGQTTSLSIQDEELWGQLGGANITLWSGEELLYGCPENNPTLDSANSRTFAADYTWANQNNRHHKGGHGAGNKFFCVE